MKVATFNGCKVYDLSSGKKLPEWLSDGKKRELLKDNDYRRRLELIQDFEVPIAAQCIKMTKDKEHIIVTGVYPPIVKCYTVTDMSLKFQRGLTSEVVAMECLTENFGKLVFLQTDRTLNFHAPYGTHYSVRVPHFGRDLLYDWNSCDLFVAGSEDEVYRFNLESGCFKEPIKLNYTGCNKMHINPCHPLLACGGEYSNVEFYDLRNKKLASKLQIQVKSQVSNNEITSLKFDNDGITFAAGTTSGHVFLYDIRSHNPLHIKEHQYNLPIIDISYHHSPDSTTSDSYVISSDKKVMKIWNKKSSSLGQVLTNIETPKDINSVCLVDDSNGRQSGLVFLAGEQSRIMTYFVPQLGPAPKWCSYLEGLTEELEETTATTNSVYADYKFITSTELEELGATSLIGTTMLKGYMHGYFIDMTLYSKLRAVSKPFEYEEHRKKKIQDKINEKKETRINKVKRLPKVNKVLAEKIMKTDSAAANTSLLADPRFSSVFQREEFEQDMESHEYKLRNPSTGMHIKKSNTNNDSDDDNMLYSRVDTSSSSRANLEEEDEGWDTESENENDEEDVSIDSGSDDDFDKVVYKDTSDNNKYNTKKNNNSKLTSTTLKKQKHDSSNNSSIKMYEVNSGVDTNKIIFGHTNSVRSENAAQKQRAAITLKDRIKSEEITEDNTHFVKGHKKPNEVKVFKSPKEGIVRELSYVPSSKGGAGLGREERDMRDDSYRGANASKSNKKRRK